jgi:hypothetical protein
MPSPMPDDNFLFCRCGGLEGGIYVVAEDGAPRRILPDVSVAQYAPSPDPELGYILFSRGSAVASGAGGTLMAQGIHPRSLNLVGSAVAIAERVNGFSASDTGVLVYSTDSGSTPAGVPGILEGQLTWFDRAGRVQSTVGDPGIVRIPRISPDGQFVALEQADRETQNMDIYVFEFARGVNNNLPKPETKFTSISAGRRGLVNLSRKFGGDTNRRFVWLKATITSDIIQSQILKLGFSDEIWVYLNKQPIFVDKDLYIEGMRKSPNGRISLDNSQFPLPLKQGENELLIAVANNFYGWGILARLEHLEGLEIEK